MNPVNVDAGTIDRMVREVLNQLQPTAISRFTPTMSSDSLAARSGETGPETNSPRPGTPGRGVGGEGQSSDVPAPSPPAPLPRLRGRGKLGVSEKEDHEAATTTISQPAVTPSARSVVLSEKVITADLLQAATQQGSRIVIGRQAILTPSAQDYLRKHRLTWERIELSAAGQTAAAKWRVLLSSVNDSAVRAIEVVCQKRPEVRRELTGGAAEAVAVAVSAISRAEVSGVIIVTTVPYEVACRANRHTMIRAAATDLSNWTDVENQLRPNVVCISPVGRSFMEVQNLLNKVVSGTAPAVPYDVA